MYITTSRGSSIFAWKGSNWRVPVFLPIDLKLRLGDHMTVERDSDKPDKEGQQAEQKAAEGQK
jgi:hypothetical protein